MHFIKNVIENGRLEEGLMQPWCVCVCVCGVCVCVVCVCVCVCGGGGGGPAVLPSPAVLH